ncbi:MAG: tRNA (adenosine(37)-N6)-threonylcarbamoyltransferase complex ATPase subunit type 1 TsaE [Christensenellaceae bacterium]|jgi:tRNA threonylcarbamoyladenosine biosynthesis protein TsaE|nr:tRNA (adenosine(37)-N6)-threonylcarbamoyltransferase complex ATPase subunit type 1 TsaE [Christensenellaceae bacterium]
MIIFKTVSAIQTKKLASLVAQFLNGGEVIALNGGLGAGKTTFTQGLALALGVGDRVNSPTFNIVKEYNGLRFKLYHIDMYRIEDSVELLELGIEDCLVSDSITVIEWNKLNDIDAKIIDINITVTDSGDRIFTVDGLDFERIDNRRN